MTKKFGQKPTLTEMCEKHAGSLVIFEDEQEGGAKYCEKCYSEVEARLKSKQESAAAAEEEKEEAAQTIQQIPEAASVSSTQQFILSNPQFANLPPKQQQVYELQFKLQNLLQALS